MTDSNNAVRRALKRILIAAVSVSSLTMPLRTPGLAADQARTGPRASASRTPERVTGASVWRPGDAALKAIRSKCGQAAPREYGECFIMGMREHGASPEAIAFTRALAAGRSGPGYIEDFTEGGRVAVAHVVFPGQDRSRGAWLLVNGSPTPVDVDNLSLLPLAEVRSDIVFQEIRRTYTRASVFAEPRSDPSPPLIPRPAEAQEFLVNYALLDGCGTCRRVGSAQFAFDFDSNGRFEGASLRGVWMTRDQGTLAPVSITKDFHIHLVADHSAGYRWQLASPLDERFVSLVSTTYSTPEAKSGTLGVEDWIFHPRAQGRTIIRFEKLLQGEKNPPRNRRFFVVVTVQ